MTISSVVNKIQISSGSSINITNLEIQDSSQILVTKKDASNVETTLAITTDYTVNSTLDTVTLNVALGASETATASLNILNTQGTDYVNNSPLNAETVETALDKLTLKNKQQQEEIDRAVKFVVSETASSNIEVPDVTGNGDKYLKLNSLGTAFEWASLAGSGGLGNVVDDISPQLGGDLDTNSYNILFDNGKGIKDDSGNEQLSFTKISSAVNHVDIQNAGAGNIPVISSAGTDTNIDLKLHGKNTGNVILSDGTDITKEISFEIGGATTAKTATVVSSHTDNRTITLPDATDTLVGKATTDTLTNKTFDANGTGNSLSNVDVADLANGTDGELITWDSSGAPATVSTGTSGHVLTSNGTGTAPTFQAFTGGKVLQVVNTTDSAVATGTNDIPLDDTIPQNTEGTEFMTLSITPSNVNNILIIDVVFNYANNNASGTTVALFQDSTADALAGVVVNDNAGTLHTNPANFKHYMTAGTTSSTTFKVRAGDPTGAGATITFNGQSGARLLGGVMASSITITEIEG